MARKSILERIVDESAGKTVIGHVSASAERIAEEMAREWLEDEALRRSWRQYVQRRTRALLDELLRTPTKRTRSRRRRRKQPRRG